MPELDRTSRTHSKLRTDRAGGGEDGVDIDVNAHLRVLTKQSLVAVCSDFTDQ